MWYRSKRGEETSVLVFLESEEAPAAGLDFLSIEKHTVFSRKPS